MSELMQTLPTIFAALILHAAEVVGNGFSRGLESNDFYREHYGITGLLMLFPGNRETWRMQLQVLRSKDDTIAMDFKKSIQNDSNIIAVASTILAQVAITALSLENLSRAHWVARAFLTFSLLSSIMTVYYATNRYRTLGRCLRPEQVRGWFGRLRRADAIQMPAIASVLIISAPSILFSKSLISFLIGLSVYLGYRWTRNLDEVSGPEASRAVCITYIGGLAFCYWAYIIILIVDNDQSYMSENDFVR